MSDNNDKKREDSDRRWKEQIEAFNGPSELKKAHQALDVQVFSKDIREGLDKSIVQFTQASDSDGRLKNIEAAIEIAQHVMIHEKDEARIRKLQQFIHTCYMVKGYTYLKKDIEQHLAPVRYLDHSQNAFEAAKEYFPGVAVSVAKGVAKKSYYEKYPEREKPESTWDSLLRVVRLGSALPTFGERRSHVDKQMIFTKQPIEELWRSGNRAKTAGDSHCAQKKYDAAIESYKKANEHYRKAIEMAGLYLQHNKDYPELQGVVDVTRWMELSKEGMDKADTAADKAVSAAEIWLAKEPIEKLLKDANDAMIVGDSQLAKKDYNAAIKSYRVANDNYLNAVKMADSYLQRYKTYPEFQGGEDVIEWSKMCKDGTSKANTALNSALAEAGNSSLLSSNTFLFFGPKPVVDEDLTAAELQFDRLEGEDQEDQEEQLAAEKETFPAMRKTSS